MNFGDFQNASSDEEHGDESPSLPQLQKQDSSSSEASPLLDEDSLGARQIKARQSCREEQPPPSI